MGAWVVEKEEYKLDCFQKDVLNICCMEKEESLVIAGGPGTGKTILAMEVAERKVKERLSVLHLMYNVPLSQYVQQKQESLLENNVFYNVTTFHKWLYKFFKDLGVDVPKGKDDIYDWTQIEHLFRKMKLGGYYDVVITDETQDFPPELLRMLKHLSEQMISFVDTNQSFEKKKTYIGEIKEILHVERELSLENGYRSTKQIIEAAGLFATNKKTLPFVLNKGSYPKMIKCGQYEDFFEAQNITIKNIIKDNPDKSIGIIVNSKNRSPLQAFLEKEDISFTVHIPGGFTVSAS